MNNDDFKNAIKQRSLKLYHQPKIDLKTKKIIGAEGLLRWEHPEKGLIMPGEILPFVEQQHLYSELTLYLLTIAFEDIQLWLHALDEVAVDEVDVVE